MSKTEKKSGSKTAKKKGNGSKKGAAKFQKIELHKHIILRPDSYIGSCVKEKMKMWIFNMDKKGNEPIIILKEISYVPGLYKIFDEILVNARDHYIRCIEEKKTPCTIIKVTIDQEAGRITVWNNGAGILVEEHPTEKILIPSMIFGELLTGENFDDKEVKIVGGRNGLGSKLTNIYSKEFIVETLDENNDKKFYQKFSDNMYTKDKPKVTSGKGKKPYTKISFIPDYEKFGLKGLSDDMVALFQKRVFDIAFTTAIKVYYNDKLITANNFTKYVDLYFPDGSEHKKVLDIGNKRWKICVVYDPTDKLEHQNISFVNGICTYRGGKHVDSVSSQIVDALMKSVIRKLKNVPIKSQMIKENLIIFVDSIINNPRFDTQTKERLTSNKKEFGSSYKITETFIKKVIKTGVVDSIIANANAKAQANLDKMGGKKNKQPVYEKLYDAHDARKRKGDCTLILTEGDSAKGFAMSGLNIEGLRNKYGVFPLRGKLLNVRDESAAKIAKNAEIQAIMEIVGLETKKEYKTLDGLRYGSIMVLTDADVDGLHIKGLIMNFVHYFWPSLIKHEGFIRSFNTPLLKATKGKKNKKVIEFTNMQTFDEWKKENDDGKGWHIKYYKGLGTHSPEEAEECFDDLEDKLIQYYWKTKMDKENKEKKEKKEKKIKSEFIDEESDVVSETLKPKKSDISEDAMILAFADGEEDRRKLWLNTYNPNVYIDDSEKRVSIYDFIHKEMIAFSVDDTMRSVPNLMDGLKPGQRKVFFASVKKNIYTGEIKVAQLSGYIAEHTHYHHNEQSLHDTIIKMAQNYVGSNNINLLMPIGQFGTRLAGGKDAASPRYIHTQLDQLSKKIFIPEDFDILQKQYEDGDLIEPVFYAPVIPMILVNGTEGIGTGYSSTIEPTNPRDVVSNCKKIIAGEKTKVMKPWYRHFTGEIVKDLDDDKKYYIKAKYEINGDTVHITDLPIGTWTENYKSFLNKLILEKSNKKNSRNEPKKGKGGSKTATPKGRGKRGAKQAKYLAKKSRNSRTAKVAKSNPIAPDIKSYKENCSDVKVDFTIVFQTGKLKKYLKHPKDKKGVVNKNITLLEKHLKLTSSVKLTNMHLFDERGKIKKYDSYGAILKNFAKVRLELYQKRKDFLLDKWRKEMDMLKWKLKFVEGVNEEKILVFKKKVTEIIAQLEKLKFPKFITGEKEDKEPSYNYLTSMTILKFSVDEVNKLKKMIEDKKEEIEILEGKTPPQLWSEELDVFMNEYTKWEAECDARYDARMLGKKGTRKRPKKQTKEEKIEVV